jgi:hypothetical protein
VDERLLHAAQGVAAGFRRVQFSPELRSLSASSALKLPRR